MPSALSAATVFCVRVTFFKSASPVLSNMAPCIRTRFTPYLARRRAHCLRPSLFRLFGGPFTAQKRTGWLFAEWTNSSPRAAMMPCSPATFSFNERRSMALLAKESVGGLNANQFVSAAANAKSKKRMPERKITWTQLDITGFWRKALVTQTDFRDAFLTANGTLHYSNIA